MKSNPLWHFVSWLSHSCHFYEISRLLIWVISSQSEICQFDTCQLAVFGVNWHCHFCHLKIDTCFHFFFEIKFSLTLYFVTVTFLSLLKSVASWFHFDTFQLSSFQTLFSDLVYLVNRKSGSLTYANFRCNLTLSLFVIWKLILSHIFKSVSFVSIEICLLWLISFFSFQNELSLYDT